MNLRWLFGNFTDPQYQLSWQEQFALSKRAHQHFLPKRRYVLWTLLVVLPPAMLAFALLNPVMRWLGLGTRTDAHTIGFAVIIALFWPWSSWAYRRLYAKPVRKAMREVGYDLCIECGYELRGLSDDIAQCPECGAPRTFVGNTPSHERIT